MHTTSSLAALRQWLEANHLDGMIVPRADAWQSEYCAPYDEKLAWLTGFDGSAGLALVLKDKALLFVDGRYQVQARVQVNLDDVEIHHLHNEPLAQWLSQNVKEGTRIGFEALDDERGLSTTVSHAVRAGAVEHFPVRYAVGGSPCGSGGAYPRDAG
jgi:Xaa-Pro aminopeptidase